MILDSLIEWDKAATLWINSFHCWFSDQFFFFLSDRKVMIPFYAIVALFLVRRLGWKKAVVVIVSLALTILACDQFGNLIKNTVGRLRPCYNMDMLTGGLHQLEGRGGFYGFFSAHAANAFGFALCALIGFRNDKSLRYRHFAIFVIIWAILIGVSRIFSGKHFLGDVLAGFIVGAIFGILIGRATRFIINRFFKDSEEPSPSAETSNL